MKGIFDRSFKYVTSADTDLRRTFARIRREQLKQARNPRSRPDGGENIVSLTVPKKVGERI